MPNHVATILTIVGDDAEIKRFVAAVDKGEDNHFDFDGLLPMPEELHGTSSPVRIQTQEEIDAIWAEYNTKKENGTLEPWLVKEGKPWGLGLTQAKHDELISKYGYPDWYSWKNANYGTKWGAYDADEWEISEGSAKIYYRTAWSPAINFFITVSKQFPSLVFTMEYADEGGGFVSCTMISNGEITDDKSFDWKSDEGIVIRKLVGYYWDEDEDEDEEYEEDEDSSEIVVDTSGESDQSTSETNNKHEENPI